MDADAEGEEGGVIGGCVFSWIRIWMVVFLCVG